MVSELTKRGKLAYWSPITALVLRSPYEAILSLQRIKILLTDTSWCRQIDTLVRAAQTLSVMTI